MAVSATSAVWEHSEATGNARLALLALADHVNEKRLRAGDPWEAWPSQNTLAAMCKCSRSTIQLALEGLVALGEIADTGERRLRGTIVWEVFPRLDLTENESGPDDMTEIRSGGVTDGHDLTDSRTDLTDLPADLTDSQAPPDRPIGHKPVVNAVVKPEIEPSSPSAPKDVPSTSDSISDSPALPAAQATPSEKQQHVEAAERADQEKLLADLEAALERKPKDTVTLGAIETVRAELGVEDDGLSDLSDPDDGELERQRLHREGDADAAPRCACPNPKPDDIGICDHCTLLVEEVSA